MGNPGGRRSLCLIRELIEHLRVLIKHLRVLIKHPIREFWGGVSGDLQIN